MIRSGKQRLPPDTPNLQAVPWSVARYFGPVRHVPVIVTAIYWYFLATSWAALFFVVYVTRIWATGESMPSDIIPYSLAEHPARHRGRVSNWTILYGVFGGGIVWAGHLMLNFALTVHACYPGTTPLARPDSGAGWAFPLILGLDIVALLLIAGSFWAAYVAWRRTGGEAHGHHHHLMEKGEGRTRFLGITGMGFAIMFFLITLTDTISLAMVPICAR